MAETCFLPSGRMEVILEDKGDFLLRLLKEHLGDDVARVFSEYTGELNEDLEIERERFRSGECNADGYLEMCRDACSALESIITQLDAPRLNRKALQAAARRAYDDLNNNL